MVPCGLVFREDVQGEDVLRDDRSVEPNRRGDDRSHAQVRNVRIYHFHDYESIPYTPWLA